MVEKILVGFGEKIAEILGKIWVNFVNFEKKVQEILSKTWKKWS